MLTKNLGDVFEQTRIEQTFKLEMTNITWKIPHVTPSDVAIAFRSWDSYVNPNWGLAVNTAGI